MQYRWFISALSKSRVLFLCGTLMTACASPQPKSSVGPSTAYEPGSVYPPEEEDDVQDGLQVEGTLGTLEQDAIQTGVGRQLPGVERCFEQFVRQQPYLGGAMSLRFRVARNGTVKQLLLVESTVGSFDVETCVLNVLRRAVFSRPRGGEAEFRLPLRLPERVPALAWEEGMVKDVILAHKAELLTVQEGGQEVTLPTPKQLVITFFVDAGGNAVSVGMAAEEQITEQLAGRLIEGLKQLKFEEPQGSIAKVTYAW